MNDLLKNDWFISIASSIATIFIVSAGTWIVRKVRAYRGMFSGYYLAITTIPRTGNLIIELVRCHHIGNKLTGIINGIGIINAEGNEGSLSTKFKFSGKVAERLLTVSYWPIEKQGNNAGSLTINGSTEGDLFIGTWAGLENEKVVASKCKWYKLPGTYRLPKDQGILIRMAMQKIFKDSELFILKDHSYSGKLAEFRAISLDEKTNKPEKE